MSQSIKYTSYASSIKKPDSKINTFLQKGNTSQHTKPNNHHIVQSSNQGSLITNSILTSKLRTVKNSPRKDIPISNIKTAKVVLTETSRPNNSKDTTLSKNFEASYNNYEGLAVGNLNSTNNHNKNIKSLSNYKPSTTLPTEEKKNQYPTNTTTNSQDVRAMTSNKNTITSAGNLQKDNSVGRRRAESTALNSHKQSNSKTKTCLIAGYNKLVANNNEYFKKYNSEHSSGKNEKEKSSVIHKPVVKIDFTSVIPQNNKREDKAITVNRQIVDSTLKQSEFGQLTNNASQKQGVNLKPKESKEETKKIQNKNIINSITNNFKQILQNTKISTAKGGKTTVQSKAATPKPEGDKQLNNEISKKSIAPATSNQGKKPNLIKTNASSTGIKINTTSGSQMQVEIKYTNNHNSKIKSNLSQRAPSRISEKQIKKPMTSATSPKSSGKQIFSSKGYLSGHEERREIDLRTSDNENKEVENKNSDEKDHEKNYFLKEAEALTDYIKSYYQRAREFPVTSIKFYKFGRLLGRGAFGKVNLGLHILTGKLVAIKSFNKNALQNEKSKRKILQEVRLMQKLKQNTVVKIYETFETQKYLIIIMEYISGGDLLSYVKKRNKLTESVAKYIFRQIITSLDYTHCQNIVHRDIKLDNILLDIHGNIKICDFGVSKYIKARKEIMYDQCGTPAYIAPEILKGQGYEGPPVDFWSAGVVLYAMLSGTVPFKTTDMNELHRMILRGEYSQIEGVSKEANNLISSILEVDPRKRFTAEEILNHPWLMNENPENGTSSKMELFGNAERILLAKSDIDYRSADKDNLMENFTLKNLDTKNDIHFKNVATKSHILAPFNSSLKDSLVEEYEYDLEVNNEMMKLIGKVKEANHQYELNNNNEFDYGVIKKQNSKEKEKEKDRSSSATPFEMNSGLISPPQDNPSNRYSGINTPRSDSLTHKTKPKSTSMTTQTFVIDEEVIKQVEEMGYTRDYILKSLNNNDLNHSTTCYYILHNNKLYEDN